MDYHSPYFFGYVLGIIHLLGIIAALHAVFTVRTAQGAIAWAMSLFFIPYFTLIPYLIFGARSFYAYIQARRQANQEMHVAMQPQLAPVGGRGAHGAGVAKLCRLACHAETRPYAVSGQ